MASQHEWSVGYARQAGIDLASYELLKTEPVPDCHRLQFLQMACEKLCKAHLCEAGAPPASLQGSHAYVAGTLPVILNKTYALFKVDSGKGAWIKSHASHLSAEIEVLAPAVKRAGVTHRKDNCEYPWEDELSQLHIPLDWQFLPTKLLDCAAGRIIEKLLRIAIDRLLS